MEEKNPFSGNEYAGALSVLHTLIQKQRYEDFYNGFQVNLLSQELDQSDRRNYYDNVVLPLVMTHVIGNRLHGDKLIVLWRAFFKEAMSGMSWEESILNSITSGAETFAEAVKAIQKNIDDFERKNR